jgi:hypothetical protein
MKQHKIINKQTEKQNIKKEMGAGRSLVTKLGIKMARVIGTHYERRDCDGQVPTLEGSVLMRSITSFLDLRVIY